MSPEELRIQELEERLEKLEKSDRFTIYKTLQMMDGINIQSGRKTGTTIGTDTDQLIGFYGTTPVDQPATVADSAVSGVTGGDTVSRSTVESNFVSLRDATNAIIDRLQELGLIA